MKKNIFTITMLTVGLTLIGCSNKIIELAENKLKVVNRTITASNPTKNTLTFNNKEGVGLATIKDIDFEVGTIEIDLKGENTPGRSFVGIAFNIQNDSTYEAIYFRPFNFQSKEQIRREHSVQYISVPKYDWRILRTNHEGEFEAEYGRQPSPEDWFAIKIKVEPTKVSVYDKASDKELLTVKRLDNQKSNKIGLWMGYNSKGAFRNLSITK